MLAAPPARLAQALERRDRAVDRLGSAGTSVRFVVVDRPEWSCTLLLDRRPPMVVAADQPAEIDIELTAEQLETFTTGGLSMPNALTRGWLACRGPVRKYLAVDPLLRGLLPGIDGAPTSAPRNGAHPPSDLSDLLALETRELVTSFGDQRVLSGCNLAIPEGSAAVVLGPSGVGKSVLLKHIIGLLAPDSGEVLVRNRPLAQMSRSEILALRRDIGVMFQDGALYSSMSVYANVAFPLQQHSDLEDDQIREVVMHHLNAVGLQAAAKRYPHELSGGMRKRAGLARSLVLEPSILLCDEPDSGLDPVRTSLLGELLVERHRELGGTLLVVTHDVALARLISDHISLLWQGRIVESGPAEEVFTSDEPFVEQFLKGNVAGPLGMD